MVFSAGGALAAAAMAIAAGNLRAETVFQIGKPDARAAEFNNFGANFNSTRYYYRHGTDPYAAPKKFFSKPFVFDVSKHTAADFPFVYPIGACEWADDGFIRPRPDDFQYSAVAMFYIDKKGRDYPPIAINFNLAAAPASDLYFKVGFADKSPIRADDVSMTVSANGEAVSTAPLPYECKEGGGYPCFASILMHPQTWGIPAASVVKIPRGLLRAGANQISIKFNRPEKLKPFYLPRWVAFDYLILDDTPELPNVENPYAAERAKMLASLDFDEIVFTMRGTSHDAHYYGNFGFYPDMRSGYTAESSPLAKLGYSFRHGMFDWKSPKTTEEMNVFSKKGGKLVKFNFRTGEIKELVSDETGGVRNVCVDFDAGKMLFSYRRGGTGQYHMYEIKPDGSGMRLMPFSGGIFDDIEGTYLPNGDVVFGSTRCERTVPCWMVDVAILHRYYAGENKVRRISANIDQDNSAAVTGDGRLIYTKWEYVQKSHLNFHAIWKKDPNGANDMVFFGNDIPRGLLIDAKPFEEPQNKYAFSLHYYHGQRDHKGQIAVIDNPRNPGDLDALKFISGDDPMGTYYAPFPVSKDYVLASEGDKLFVFDLSGHAFELPLPESFKPFKDTFIFDAQPLRPRKRPEMPADMADYDCPDATVVLMDASIGRNMAGVKKSDIKKLMIVEVLPNIIHLYGGTEPISLRGTFSIERCLGTVNVEDDGSAHFKAPANRALAFVALDENGRAVKRMQSFTSFAGGTSVSCIGCHEHRDMAPPPITGRLKALRRAPDKPAPIAGVRQGEVIDFVRDIQPVLDKHCAGCHNPRDFRAKLDLTDAMGPMFPTAYFNLRTRRQLRDGDDRDGNMPPHTFGSGGSPLMDKISGKHHKAKLSPEEENLLKAWLDMGSIASASCACVESGMLAYYYSNLLLRADEKWGENKTMADVFQRRCASCHSGEKFLPEMLSGDKRDLHPWLWNWNIPKNSPRNRLSHHAAFNFKTPENSAVLMAPLDARAGGRASNKGHAVVFKNKKDPDYRAVLAAIERAKKYLETENPRYTESGYKPRGAYYGALLRRGIIKKGDSLENFSPFEADKKYWQKVISKQE